MKAKKPIQKSVLFVAALMMVVVSWDNVGAAIGPSGDVYQLGGDIAGHQRNPHIVANLYGGFAVWEHESENTHGSRILFQSLNSLLEQNGSPIRVSSGTSRDDEANPQVGILPNGGAVVVWDAGPRNDRDVYIRFLSASGSPLTSAQVVNSFRRGNQDHPTVAINGRGTVLVAWESQYQDGAGDGIFARQFTPQGVRYGQEMQVNQEAKWNQSSPQMSLVDNDNFMMVWKNEVEQGRQMASAGTGKYAGSGELMQQVGVSFMRSRIMGRAMNGSGRFVGNEFRVDGGQALCASPAIAAMKDGGFCVAWEELNESGYGKGQDIFVRRFTSTGQPLGERKLHNKYGGGDQTRPALAMTEAGMLVAWDCGSLTTRGSEIHGRLLSGGAEMRLNVQVPNKQSMVAAAGNGKGMMLVVWAEVVNARSVVLKARRFNTANPTTDLAAGPDVEGGGQGANRIMLVAKQKEQSPGQATMEQEAEEAIGNAIVQHESELNEAMRTTQAAAKEATKVVKQASAQVARNVAARQQARVSVPSIGIASSRPVNASVVRGTTQQSTARNVVSGSFGTHPSSAGLGGTAGGTVASKPATRPGLVVARPAGTQSSAAPTISANTIPQSGGVTRQNNAIVRGASSSAVNNTSQIARNTLINSARAYQTSRRIGMGRPGLTVRPASPRVSTAGYRGNYNIQSRIGAVVNSQRVQRTTTPNSQLPAFGHLQRSNANRAKRTIGSAFGSAISSGSNRFTENRNNASRTTMQARQLRNVAVPSSVTQQNGRLSLHHSSRAGVRYQLEMSNDRQNWSTVGRPHVGTGRSMSVPFQSNGQRYIRVVPRN